MNGKQHLFFVAFAGVSLLLISANCHKINWHFLLSVTFFTFKLLCYRNRNHCFFLSARNDNLCFYLPFSPYIFPFCLPKQSRISLSEMLPFAFFRRHLYFQLKSFTFFSESIEIAGFVTVRLTEGEAFFFACAKNDSLSPKEVVTNAAVKNAVKLLWNIFVFFFTYTNSLSLYSDFIIS